MDDSVFIGNPGISPCEVPVDRFLHLSSELEVPLASDKVKGPATILTFLGIVIDSVKHTILFRKQRS